LLHEVATRSRFFYARVAVLLAVLVVVVAYAIHDVRSRRARKAWDHTLRIAVVVLKKGAVDDAAVGALRDRTPVLEARLEEELHRYKPGAPKPFSFVVQGPIDAMSAAPAVTSDGVVDLATHAWDLHRWTNDADDRAKLEAAAFDARIYVTAEPPNGKVHMVEGASEQGGRVGVVSIDLDAQAVVVDFALSVIAHELFHTLDATDKYDSAGHASVPDGLAEPELGTSQRFVELMARDRPSGGAYQTLDTIDEIAVGPATAREIGWSEQK
jgi:hypothetical protein